MAQQTINVGSAPNDGTGTPLRTAFQYTNSNFSELYTALGGGSGLPGATTQVIFNDGGTNLAGDAGLVYNKTTDTLQTGSLVVPGNVQLATVSTLYVGTLLNPKLKVDVGGTGVTTITEATITGDLTVDTSTLKVDSANNRVGIGTATPSNLFHVQGSGDIARFTNGSNNAYFAIDSAGYTLFTGAGQTGNGIYAKASTNSVQLWTNGAQRYDIDSTGVSTWSVGGSTAMTLNSTGLGVGVTPSAWGAAFKAIQVSGGASLMGDAANAYFGNNCYYNGTSWIYSTTNGSSRFELTTSGIKWYNAGVGTAGNAITFTQAMTLDASGNLLVGKTAAGPTTRGFEAVGATGIVNSTVANDTNSVATFAVYSTIAAAYRFYVGLAGTVFATNTTISAISDARLKENVQDIDVGLGAILALKPRKFDWKAGKGKDIKGDRGFIAQEFEQVFPQLVDEWKDAAPEGEAPYKSVRQDLIPVLVKAIQELTARVQTLETR